MRMVMALKLPAIASGVRNTVSRTNNRLTESTPICKSTPKLPRIGAVLRSGQNPPVVQCGNCTAKMAAAISEAVEPISAIHFAARCELRTITNALITGRSRRIY